VIRWLALLLLGCRTANEAHRDMGRDSHEHIQHTTTAHIHTYWGPTSCRFDPHSPSWARNKGTLFS
jgi:hypothetical protein